MTAVYQYTPPGDGLPAIGSVIFNPPLAEGALEATLPRAINYDRFDLDLTPVLQREPSIISHLALRQTQHKKFKSFADIQLGQLSVALTKVFGIVSVPRAVAGCR
jgi:hypothetical protein